LGGDEDVTGQQQISHFGPVDLASIKAERYPSSGRHICRKIESARLSFNKRLVLARENFAGDSHDAIAVVVVEKIGEGLLADEKLRV